MGIGELIQQLLVLKSLEGLGSAMQDEDRFVLPTHHDLLSRLNLAEVDLDWATLRKRGSVWIHLLEERNQRCRGAYGGDRRGRNVQEVPSRRPAGAGLGRGRRQGCAAHS